MNIAKREGTHVRVFLMGDDVRSAVKGQGPPQGYYNIEHMMTSALRQGEVII